MARGHALRSRLDDLARRLGAADPSLLGGQLAVLINGAFVSASLVSPTEAERVLQAAADALVAASA